MNRPHCTAYFAMSLDGFIADAAGGVDWLNTEAAAADGESDFEAFIGDIDALLMGRVTFLQFLAFGEWPYSKPIFVLRNSLTELPGDLGGEAYLIRGTPRALLAEMQRRGHHRLYIDGGETVRSFLAEDLIDGISMTLVPILLGSGVRIFGERAAPLTWTHESSRVLADHLVQSTSRRCREAPA